ncbi:MCE family protein [Crossiella cryophila]|uniref:Virulence factor Mce-like protein n=1 Tax=Crossiella cryophila TaxID=43355 RepID=A0A7W7C702_9PSEU|nr:MCE family protein [Crossiella cryophila]MBB4674373.1 virulence factor Mce-like protein [Crossiella cryophila]
MSTSVNTRPDLARLIAFGAVVVLLLTATLWWVLARPAGRLVTAYFSAGIGVYEGGDVRVLGVRVGVIDKVEAQGTQVKVEMRVDRDVELPERPNAAVVNPSVVSDRYVQLAPVYTGGPKLGENTVIPRERTVTPMELDEVYGSLDKLTTALGPKGANKDGALSQLLDVSADNLAGNGKKLQDTIRGLGDAAGTLNGAREDLFGTIDNLRRFTSMLAANDSQVRTFNTQLADVNRFLAAEREDLGAAVRELAGALSSVEGFIRDNREQLKSNVDKLASITKVLVDQRAALAEVLDVAPLALGNLQNTYNASSGTLDTRTNINELTRPPIVMVCELLRQTTPKQLPQVLADVCGKLAGVVDGVVKLPSVAEVISSLQQGKLPQLPPLLGVPGGKGSR